MPVNEIEPVLDTWVKNLKRSDPDYYEKVREALFVYQSHEIVKEELITILAGSADYGAKMVAAQAVGRWGKRINDPLSYLRVFVKDKDPRVRLHAVVAAGNIPDPQSIVASVGSAGHSKGFIYRICVRKSDLWIKRILVGCVTA